MTKKVLKILIAINILFGTIYFFYFTKMSLYILDVPITKDIYMTNIYITLGIFLPFMFSNILGYIQEKIYKKEKFIPNKEDVTFFVITFLFYFFIMILCYFISIFTIDYGISRLEAFKLFPTPRFATCIIGILLEIYLIGLNLIKR